MRQNRTREQIYHGGKVALYYTQLHSKFGEAALLKHLPQLRNIVWSREGLKLVEKHLKLRRRK